MSAKTSNSVLRERPLRLALFAHGFRPFFLGAGLYAVIIVAAWTLILRTGGWPAHAGDPVAWHAHEMLFGFAGAAIAGFLLTAVPNWTGSRGFSGPALVALFALWLAGRVLVAPLFALPPIVPALVDVAFFPALGAMVLPSIIAARNRRNYVFLALLGLLTVGSALYHADRMDLLPGAWAMGRTIAAYVILLMVTLIGGRIVPSFTSSALRRQGCPVEIRPGGAVDRLAIGLLVALAVADLVRPVGTLAGLLALSAGIAHAVRLAGWHGLKTWRDPLVWVLHLGYAWIPVGLLLKASWVLGGWDIGMGWMHAITIGAFATMILAVMSRAALGHTGRPLVAARATVAAYVLVTVAALARVAGPLVTDISTAYALAGVHWIAAFLLFSWVYVPILTQRRADGRPG